MVVVVVVVVVVLVILLLLLLVVLLLGDHTIGGWGAVDTQHEYISYIYILHYIFAYMSVRAHKC